MNKDSKVTLVFFLIVAVVAALKFVPIRTTTSDIFSKAIDVQYTSTTTIGAQKGGVVSGSFSVPSGSKVNLTIVANTSASSIVYSVTSASSGSFSFTPDTDQGYTVAITSTNLGSAPFTVILNATQTTTHTFL